MAANLTEYQNFFKKVVSIVGFGTFYLDYLVFIFCCSISSEFWKASKPLSLLTFRLHRVRQWELGIVYVNGMKSNLNVYVNGQSNPQSCTSMGVFVYVNGVIAYMNGSLWCTSMGVSVYSETQHVRANCVKKNFVSTR